MPAGKTYTRIASQTTTGSVQTVTFSNLPQNFTDLVCVMQVVSSSSNTLFMRFNSNTGSNYSATRLSGSGTAAVCDRDINATYGLLSNYAYPTSTAGNTNTILQIPNYSNTTTNKTFLVRSNSAGAGVDAIVGLWRQTSAINSISFSTNGFTSSTSISSGSIFTLYGIECAKNPYADGGNSIYTDGTYWIHVFNSSGLFTPNRSLTADYLLVAGGGGGGNGSSSTGDNAGGGGAGGYRYFTSQSLTQQTYAVTVGGGGASQTNGTGSTFINSVTGGGRGGGSGAQIGASGGSGGGGSTTGTGYAGGSGNAGSYSPSEGNTGSTGRTSSPFQGGGGGGSGSAPVDSGNGGSATSNSISGTSISYAGGGGGGNNGTAGTGGTNAGNGASNTNVATSGIPNRGGGGGGGNNNGAGMASGGLGGSGIVIVRYPI